MRYLAKFRETESRMVVVRSWGRGKRELRFNGKRVSLLQDEKVLEIYFTTT